MQGCDFATTDPAELAIHDVTKHGLEEVTPATTFDPGQHLADALKTLAEVVTRERWLLLRWRELCATVGPLHSESRAVWRELAEAMRLHADASRAVAEVMPIFSVVVRIVSGGTGT
jgi:hypothetical protein